MSKENNLQVCQNGWDAFGRGDFDTLVEDYTDDMIFVFPGQDNVLAGKAAFRSALDNIGSVIPAGFEVTGLSHCANDHEVVSIVSWKSEKLTGGSHTAVLFKFNDDAKVIEERWFLDTKQWESAMQNTNQ